jgi:hypothetical protein
LHIRRNRGSAKRVEGIAAAKYVFSKTCFNPTCKCKELKIVREVTLRCSNCHCGVKVEERKIKPHDSLIGSGQLNPTWTIMAAEDLLFTVVKNGKDEP